MRKKRKQYTPEEKVRILRKHLVDKVAVSELCESYGLTTDGFLSLAKSVLRERGASFYKDGAPE